MLRMLLEILYVLMLKIEIAALVWSVQREMAIHVL